MKNKLTLLLAMVLSLQFAIAQNTLIEGTIKDGEGRPISGASISIPELEAGTTTDDRGKFSLSNVQQGKWRLEVSYVGHTTHREQITVSGPAPVRLDVVLETTDFSLDEVVVSGTMKEVS